MKTPEFIAQANDDVEAFLQRWVALQAHASTPFQTVAWLRSWYATLGRLPGVEPLCVTVTRDAEPAMLVPLVAQQSLGVRVVRFADAGVTDYNAPLVANVEAGHAPAVWTAIRKALSRYDLLCIDKMLPACGDRLNPLGAVLPTVPCDVFGNYVVVDADWDAWHAKLARPARKAFERTWRVFTREAGARFERIADMESALALFAELEAQQRERMASLGRHYRLDGPAYRALYERHLREGLADGAVVLTALRCRGELVAALYGISDGKRYVALRVSHASNAWKRCAPGKLLHERTMHHLHSQGLRHIDFGIGDYAHKRAFGLSRTPLVDACVALTWRGVPHMLAWRARRALKVISAAAN